MNRIIIRYASAMALAAVTYFVPAVSPAQDLILHLPLDGSLSHSGRTGDPRFVVRDGALEPIFVPGHFGQGLRLEGPAAVAAPFNLDHAAYPQVTVTAWVREEDGASGSRDLFSSTSTAGIRMGIHGGRLATRVGDRGVTYDRGRIPSGEWVFVAAVVDTTIGSARLYVNDDEPFVVAGIDTSTKPPPLVSAPDDSTAVPRQWVVVGATNFESFSTASRPLLIDDVRVYGGLLDDARIASLREASTDPANSPETLVDLQSGGGGFSVQSPDAPAGATAGGSLANSDNLPMACDSHDDCPAGNYCATDATCHPNSHLPMNTGSGVTLADLRARTSEQYGDVTGDLEINNPTDVFSGGSDPGETSSPSGGPQPTGTRMIGGILGRYGSDERSFEVSAGFVSSIGLGVYDSCAVKLNDEVFFTCPRDKRDVDLGVSLPSTFVTAVRVCNGFSGELRGIEARGDGQRADGSYWNQVDESTITQPARLRCGRDDAPQYGELSRCAGNALVTGLVVHTNQLWQPVGLQLICRQVGS